MFADTRFYLSGLPIINLIVQSTQLSVTESCCTPAVLFRTASVPEMVRELSRHTAGVGHAKDHILDESRFVGRQTEANFVVHIGYYSALRQRNVNIMP